MSFRKYIIIIVLLVACGNVYAQQDSTFTIQQCLDIAIKNNLQVKQSNANAQLAGIDLKQAKENIIPSIGGNVSRNFSQGRVAGVSGTYVNQSQTNDVYGLSSSMTLFNGFSLLNAVKSASYAYQAGKMNFQAAKDVVTVNVITNYLAILDNKEILSATQSQLAVQQETVDRMKVLEEQGANKAASDLTDQEGQLAGNQVAVVNAQNNLDAAKLNLFQQMNIQYQPDAKFADINAENLTGNYGTNPEQAYQTALQQFAAVKAATLSREAAEKNVSSQRGLLAPSLVLNGGLGTNYYNTARKLSLPDSTQVPVSYSEQFRNNYNLSLQVGLNIPIFSHGTYRNNLNRAKINALYSRDVEENSKIVLKQNIEQAFYNMTAAYKRYQALTEQVKAYTESYRIYKLRFDSGVITSVDFIIAKNNLDGATVNLISAKYDYFIDSKILDYYQGKLSL
jgi:outer membrane protein